LVSTTTNDRRSGLPSVYRYCTWYFIFRRGNLRKTKRRPGIWMRQKTQSGAHRIYVTCAYCARVNDVTDHYFSRTGLVYTETCVTCACGNHQWPKLEGWSLKWNAVKKPGRFDRRMSKRERRKPC
jgi:hypothetical protein